MHSASYQLSSHPASKARGFNVSPVSAVHLAAIMIYEAAPLSRAVSAGQALETRSYITRARENVSTLFFEIASFASASPTYRSIMRPLNSSLVPCVAPRFLLAILERALAAFPLSSLLPPS